jgi:predicted RNase H-like nuclease (RuvC/YqgF family)
MYKTGTNFKYNFKRPYIGSHRFHLSSLENKVKENSKFTPDDVIKINILKNECDVLRINLRENYSKLKYEMITEIDNLQSKFDLELGKQKIKNIKINNQMKELKKEMLESQNFVMELKDRINSLKLRIDGNGMFNEDGIPVLQTKIEY